MIITGQSGVTKTTRFEYAADEERLIRRDADITRHFVTDLYQRVLTNQDGGTQEEIFRLYAGEREVAQIVRQNGTDKTLYFHTDHLGSVDTISTDTGSVTRQDFDAFGTPLEDPGDPEVTRVGYTGHQHERDLGMIDMRGRMYDTLAGRFMSADPVMQAPNWSQGLNRYAYVFNDPINFVDPSGFTGEARGWATASYASVPGPAIGAYLLGAAGTYGSWAAVGAGGLGFASTFAGGIGFGSAGSTTGKTALGSAAPTSVPAAQGGMNATGQNTGLNPPVLERPPGTSLFDPESEALACGGPVPCIQRGAELARRLGPAAVQAFRQAIPWWRAQASRAADFLRTHGPRFADAASRLAENLARTTQASARGQNIVIQFGKDANQISHAFRHIDRIGLNRADVIATIDSHLRGVASQIAAGKPFNQVVTVAGQNLQYTAYQLKDGLINVGRIHPVP